jgi:single-stranded DNA-binding protein
MLTLTAVGNLARDPEIKTVGDNEVANFTILCNRKSKTGDIVTAVDCSVWGILNTDWNTEPGKPGFIKKC